MLFNQEKFIEKGFSQLSSVDPEECKKVLNSILSTRTFGPELFLSEEDFKAQTNRFGTNPRAGRNAIEKMDLAFIEDKLKPEFDLILGAGHSVLMKKAVCGVPRIWLPDYVKIQIDMVPVANLGSFIKPEYRDITYFHGIDYHQDIIDYKDRVCDFITVYVYLDDVTKNDAPLYIIPESHKLGCTLFPHDLEKLESGKYIYEQKLELEEVILTGKSGDVNVWHGALLHGTQPSQNDAPRISLRYLIQKPRGALDIANDQLQGNLKLSTTRVDLDEKHAPVIKHNLLREMAEKSKDK